MTFSIFYKNYPNGRAPEAPNPDDYEEAGTLDADSPKHAMMLVAQPDVDMSGFVREPRALKVGDVLVDENGKASILTPTFAWAEVEFEIL